MNRILLIKPAAEYTAAAQSSLAEQGFHVHVADSYKKAIAAISEADSAGSDLVGVILNWPREPDSGFHSLINALSQHMYQHLAVLLMCENMSSAAVGWLKNRKRSALLLWSDCNEVGDAVEHLLDSNRHKQHRNLNEEWVDQHMSILIVDDSPTVRIAFRRLLMKQGYLVETAESVADGYRKALQQHFDFAIIDYFMPAENGVALVTRLSKNPITRHMVSVIITGTYSDIVIKDSLAAGAVECIFKNESRELFLSRIASLSRSLIDRKSIERERNRLESILSSVGDGVYGVNADGVIQFINPAAREILGYHSEEELVGCKAFDLFHNRHESGQVILDAQCVLSQTYRTGGSLQDQQLVFWDRNGRAVDIECTVVPLEIDGARRGSVVVFRNITARRQLEEELRWQATHDSLTKLYNRIWFEEELEQELNRLRRADEISAVLFVDLDNFKYINDTAGHAAGDKMLIEVASRLQSRLRSSDGLARIGGDEYAVILRNVAIDQLQSVTDQFRLALADGPFHYQGKPYPVSASIGVARMDKGTVSIGTVMANADIACHLAKNQGRNRIHIFSDKNDHQATMDKEISWSARLDEALRNDSFVLQFQPIVSSDTVDFDHLPVQEGALWEQSRMKGKSTVPEYEVLLRLEDEEGGLISPDAFLPTAQRFNRMLDIDRWVIRHALEVLALLKRENVSCRLNINLSMDSIIDPDTYTFIRECIDTYHISARDLTFELSEQDVLSYLEATSKLTGKLKKLGCRISLDNFGTSFASLNYLNKLNLDDLKIDGNYLRTLEKEPVSRSVLMAISKIAHSMGKRTIASGIDSVAILEALRGSQVDQLQGYFIARPQASIKSDDELSNVMLFSPNRG